MSLGRLLEGLAENDVRFVVVGMIAGQLYGSRLATYDLDVLYERSEENIARLTAYMQSVDAYASTSLSSELSLTLGTIEGDIDLLHRIDGIGDYSNALSKSQPFSLSNGRTIRVLTLSALIEAKRASDRDKDRLHLQELEAIAELETDDDTTAKP